MSRSALSMVIHDGEEEETEDWEEASHCSA